MSISDIDSDGAKMKDLIENVKSLLLTDGAVNFNNCKDCEKYGQTLSSMQRAVFHQVHSSIDAGTNKVILIDAPSGTGKSYMLTQLALKYSERSLQFAVFRKDQASELHQKQIKSYTYVAYNMHNFNLQFYDAIRMFTTSRADNMSVFFLLMLHAKRYISLNNPTKVVILDAYTIASPLMLLLLYIISLKKGITLIFAGNKLQLGTVNKSNLHTRNNFDVVEIFSHQTICDMTTNLRTTDVQFLDKLSRFRNMLSSYISRGDVPFYFNLRYALYLMFPDKYNPAITEDIHSVYMAPFHHVITKRVYRLMETLKPKDYHVEPFPNVPVETTNVKGNKFFPGLFLMKGCKYLYVTHIGENYVVELVGLNYEEERLTSLTIRFASGKEMDLKRCTLTYFQILPAYRRWLESCMSKKVKDKSLFQFPLRPYVLTYHAALGRTVSDSVELETDCPKASSVYVGLCCLPSEKVIRKFHANKDYLSFICTQYMEEFDDKVYYYRFPNKEEFAPKTLEEYIDKKDHESIKLYVKSVPWVTVKSVNVFENAVDLVRIERKAYEKAKKEETKVAEPTMLMRFAGFIKDNPKLIVDIIDQIPISDYYQSIHQVKHYRNTSMYVSLSNAFAQWKAKNAESKPK